MANQKSKTCFQINSGTTYALMELDPSGSFVLYPTDADYNKIDISTINDTYSKLYYEAQRIAATELGLADGSTEQELEQRIDWVKDSTSITFTYSGGTYIVSTSAEEDVFKSTQYSAVEYLAEKLNNINSV